MMNFLDRWGVVHSVFREERSEAFGYLDCQRQFTFYGLWVAPILNGRPVPWMVTCLSCLAASRR